jgi:hypothetical protein
MVVNQVTMNPSMEWIAKWKKRLLLLIFLVVIVGGALVVYYKYEYGRFPWQQRITREAEVLTLESAVDSITERENAVATSFISVDAVEDEGMIKSREISLLGTIESVDTESMSITINLSSTEKNRVSDKTQVYLSDDTEIYLRDLTGVTGVDIVPGGFVTDGIVEIPPLTEDDKITIQDLSKGDRVMMDATLDEEEKVHVNIIELIRQ